MSERPILFSGPMVRAILEGRKTQTRRVVDMSKLVPAPGAVMPRDLDGASRWKIEGDIARLMLDKFEVNVARITCPYGAPGDTLWLKEAWRPQVSHSCAPGECDCDDVLVTYAADGATRRFGGSSIPEEWSMPKAAKRGNVPSLFLPRWASRLSLRVLSVRVQRLHEITKADIDAEGALDDAWYDFRDYAEGCAPPGSHIETEREHFAALWDSINAKRAPWSSNPWVWVVSFERAAPSLRSGRSESDG